MNALKHALRGGPETQGRGVRDIGTACGPHGGMRHTLDELEGQHPPWVTQPRDVQEPKNVADESNAEHLKTL